MDRTSISKLLASSFEDQQDAWYDWFCSDKALKAKTKMLINKLGSIAFSPKLNIYEQYAFFKNNCPMNGDLYDSFSICDIKTGDVEFYVTPKCGHKGKRYGQALVYSSGDGFDTPVVAGTWDDVVKYFMNNEG